MFDDKSIEQPTNQEIWLKSLGFSLGDPFKYVEADRERDHLTEYYVEVDGYEAIKAPQSCIVFAPRGAGKSALRVALADLAAPIRQRSKILAVEYTNFEPLLRKLTGNSVRVNSRDHVEQILKLSVEVLFNVLLKVPSRASLDHSLAQVGRIRESSRMALGRFIRQFNPRLLLPDHISEVVDGLCQIVNCQPLPLTRIVDGINENNLQGVFEDMPDSVTPLLTFLANIVDFVSPPQPQTTQELLKDFIRIVQQAGFSNLSVLVDRIDEYPETVDSPELQADLLEPLLAHLGVVELPGVAFKLFLAQDTKEVLYSRPTIRRDRLKDQIVTVIWSDTKLQKLLENRLSYFSEGKIESFAAICDDSFNEESNESTRRFQERIVEQILKLSNGSPRMLLTLCKMICDAHIQRTGVGEDSITQEDWMNARSNFLERFAPHLTVDLRKSRYIVVNQTIKLNRAEKELFQAIYEQKYPFTELHLADHLRKTDEAVKQTIYRINKKFDEHGLDFSLYLNKAGDRYQIVNTEIISEDADLS